MVNAIKEQRDLILNQIRAITRGDWKVLIIDENSKKIIDNAVKEDDILNENITNIERIEDRREAQKDTDAIYLLTPEPHILDCLMADFEKRKYRKTYLIWTSLLEAPLRRRIDVSRQASEQLVLPVSTLLVDFFPRESHLITFRDKWSFPILYHPSCNSLVLDHMQMLAQKITGICVTLGEYPKIRYYQPRNPTHEANVLSMHVAKFVQEELDTYAKYNQDFPPPSTRPQGVLVITDRCMDLMAPLVHEFTYQAMAHDLLPIKEGEKVTYQTVVHQGEVDEEEKELELSENDKVWVDNRHIHMVYTIDKLRNDFKKFIDDNPNFTGADANGTSTNAIKDMLAGLSQFTATKEAYSLHLGVATDCMSIFTRSKLMDLKIVEQTLATALDDDYRKPRNIAMDLLGLLDGNDVSEVDKLRLLLLYVLFRDGVIREDLQLLLKHAVLPPYKEQLVTNLDLIGARTTKILKENRPLRPPIFSLKPAPAANEEYPLSRFDPAIKTMLEGVTTGTLPQDIFPYTPQSRPLDDSDAINAQAQTSLRSAKPTWARNRMSTVESRQRIIVFMAGGATYSESRACYEVGKQSGRDIFLATSHMVTPSLFLKQVEDLTAERRKLDLPADRPKPKAPAHLFEREAPKPEPVRAPAAGGMGFPIYPTHVGGAPRPNNAPLPPAPVTYDPRLTQGMSNLAVNAPQASGSGKLEKKGKPGGLVVEEEKKKKKGLFHRSKK
ncbi:Sec1 family protein [Calycina marina]|uniref:Sec1 family protein n=1 Tax=Calycina marina TaxID=1763456 RepID=A0A9P8CFW0_9HELO|nr:Sec1 family protein [Calycina marina]